MKSIWSSTEGFTDATLAEALERFATIAGMSGDSIDREDLVSKINFCSRLLYVHVYKNKRYGDSWRDRLMGYRLNLAYARGKFGRLIELGWRNRADLSDASNKAIVEKIVETSHDLANYLFFVVRMIEIEYGVDYAAVRGQAIEADYEDLNLEAQNNPSR